MKTKLLILMSVLLGCEKSTDIIVKSNLAEEYFPLNIGNKWYYGLPKYDSTKVLEIHEVINMQTISGKSYYEIRISYPEDTVISPGYRYYRTETDILYEALNVAGKYQILKRADFSLDVGENYTMPIYFDADTMNYVVTVLERTNNTIKYYYNEPNWIDDEKYLGFEKNKGINYFSNQLEDGFRLYKTELYN